MLEIFGKGKLQDLRTILELCREKTVDEVIKEIEIAYSDIEPKKFNHKIYIKKCPSCENGVLKPVCGGRFECECGYSEVR